MVQGYTTTIPYSSTYHSQKLNLHERIKIILLGINPINNTRNFKILGKKMWIEINPINNPNVKICGECEFIGTRDVWNFFLALMENWTDLDEILRENSCPRPFREKGCHGWLDRETDVRPDWTEFGCCFLFCFFFYNRGLCEEKKRACS